MTTFEAQSQPPIGVEAPIPELEEELEQRFAPEVLQALTADYLENGTGQNLKELAGDRQFVVAAIPATSKYADIGKSIETSVFAEAFLRPESRVYSEYAETDEQSVLLTVIDAQTNTPAGVMRIIDYAPGHLQKSIKDLVADSPENPWLADIKATYFAPDEEYDPSEAWRRMAVESVGTELPPELCHDIATIAVGHQYRNVGGGMQSASILLYHSCLRLAMAADPPKKALVSIQDEGPFALLQRFNKPFDEFKGLGHYPYGGPYKTVPAVGVMDVGIQRAHQDPATGGTEEGGSLTGKLLIDGWSLGANALTLQEYMPETYSNEVLGLAPVET